VFVSISAQRAPKDFGCVSAARHVTCVVGKPIFANLVRFHDSAAYYVSFNPFVHMHQQESFGLKEYNLMMAPNLLTMRMRQVRIRLGRKEGGVYAWYVQGRVSYKWLDERCSRPSPRALMRI
jgi:hypothetical protein